MLKLCFFDYFSNFLLSLGVFKKNYGIRCACFFDNICRTQVLGDFLWRCLGTDWYKIPYEYYYALFYKTFSAHPVLIIRGLSA